jgi:hypothetical protein
MAELLEGQTQQANRGAAIDRLIEEQNKPRIIIKCDGLGWALVITAHGWGGIHHGSSIAVNYPTGLDCDKIITDLGLVLDEGKPEPETGKPPVAYIKLVTGDKMENFKTFNREVVARCFIDVADAVYEDRGGRRHSSPNMGVRHASRTRTSKTGRSPLHRHRAVPCPLPGTVWKGGRISAATCWSKHETQGGTRSVWRSTRKDPRQTRIRLPQPPHRAILGGLPASWPRARHW